MFGRLGLVLLLCSVPAKAAAADEIEPVPFQAVIGKSYTGKDAPSEILFINASMRPVQLAWIAFDGSEKPYGVIPSGGEWMQPTYVAHRWIVKDGAHGYPLEAFISTRSSTSEGGATQIALIR